VTSPAIAGVGVGALGARRARPRIVVLGGGFAGAYCARALERELRTPAADVLLLDRSNCFVFYPLLIEAGTGSLEPRHTVVELRALLSRTRFKMAEVLGIDFDSRRVAYRIAGTSTVEAAGYDHLVLALGSVTRLPPVPGIDRYAWEVKSLADAVALRDRAIGLLEAAAATASRDLRACLLHFVVVGGNFTGAEVAGEFEVFLRRAARNYPSIEPGDIRVTLVEQGDRILRDLGDEMSDYATRKMRSRGIDVRLGTRVTDIGPDSAALSTGERLSSSTVIWCAGIAPSPLIEALPLPKTDEGYVLCDPDLRVSGYDDVWAIGDVAANPDPDGRPYPATAQHAVRQGRHLAGNLSRALAGRAARPFVYRARGSIAALGCRTGVARVFGIKISGFAAWFLWRTVYLLKMPGWSRRLRIAIDWTLDLVFPRETVQLGVHRRPRSS
jgi:NADH dehydrogenase